MIEVKNGELFVPYFGELNQILEISDGWIWVQGEETGLPAMIKFEIFEKEFEEMGLTY